MYPLLLNTCVVCSPLFFAAGQNSSLFAYIVLKMEELQNALTDKSLTISTLPEKGRCLLTARDFSPGEVILSDSPYVCVPNKNKESPEPKCEWCFSSADLKKCSACHVVWYCSSKCQKLDWKMHSVECSALKKVDKERLKSLTPSIRLMVRLCIRLKLENQKINLGMNMNLPFTFDLITERNISEVDENQLILYAQMANLVNLILQWSDSDINIKQIAENFSKLACNAHTICDSELRPLGTGLFPVIAIINHSCLPNAVLVFEGRVAVVRAMQHIPKGTEGQPDDIRESAILEGYRCKADKCSGFLLRDPDDKGFICQQCGLLRSKEEISNITNEVKRISERASQSLSSGYKAEAYKMIEQLQQKLCHPFSINILRTRESLLKILMELQDWKEALSYSRLIILVYEWVYPSCHPLIGLQYYMSGKLEWLLGETENAVRSFTKALDVLRFTHGTKTPFVMELMGKLDEARAEASYRLRSPDDN
ncbi:N-lysine methyltransferase SMYD2 [Striga asiatica]|uniref:N-lysine methyltransferase SMYD2 n=1 Tax=Striga asiatica TaxID=4170 RepID=A0A5A7QVY8_STRAF|nr:N-lysine methyltransferase SMYD2 [Striga asiatica]